jgi:hypothetical protein
MWCLCPKGHQANVSTDYTDSKCFAECKCGEFFVCFDISYFNKIVYDNEPWESTGCTKRVDEDFARDYLVKKQFNGEEDTMEEVDMFFKTTILYVTGLQPYKCARENEDEKCIRKLEKPVVFFQDCGFPYDHGGIYMAYSAVCPVCNVKVEGTICGD